MPQHLTHAINEHTVVLYSLKIPHVPDNTLIWSYAKFREIRRLYYIRDLNAILDQIDISCFTSLLTDGIACLPGINNKGMSAIGKPAHHGRKTGFDLTRLIPKRAYTNWHCGQYSSE
jgi:hypothetical protein